MESTGCLRLTRAQASRRDFLRVGSLGFLGIHLEQYLRAASTGEARLERLGGNLEAGSQRSLSWQHRTQFKREGLPMLFLYLESTLSAVIMVTKRRDECARLGSKWLREQSLAVGVERVSQRGHHARYGIVE